MLMCFLVYDGKGKVSYWHGASKWIDILFALFSVLVAVYILSDIDGYLMRIQLRPSSIDIAMGIGVTIVILEAARRLTGASLSIIALVTILYAFFGGNLPGVLGHKGYSLIRIVKSIFSEHGIWGMPLSVSANTVFIYLLFGAFLSACGADTIFRDLSITLAGGKRGGPAKIAIIASGIFGTISGSAVANVVSTGTFTIPLMKKVGYRKEFAGAVEAVASTGGQLMPPVMGAAAFLLSEFIGVSYASVCVAAAIPAFLYYIFVFIVVDAEALKHDLRGVDKKDIPALLPVLKRSAKLIIPVLVLILSLLVFHFSPVRSAIYAMATVIILSLLDKEDRFSFSKLSSAFVQAAQGSAQIASACAASGIVIGMLSLTGLGLKFSNLIFALGGTNLFLCLLFSMVIAIILGMGLPTTAAYIITATTIGPALINLGLPPLSAHLFLFYFAAISCITPPVAVASYAGAALAEASPGKVGWEAVRLGFVAFLIPFAFVLSPALIHLDFSSAIKGIESLVNVATTLFAGMPFAYAIQGYAYGKINIILRLALFGFGIAMITPFMHLSVPAALLVAAYFLIKRRSYYSKTILSKGEAV
jgi:TRAP transporter 4TM/12TM fusion protein